MYQKTTLPLHASPSEASSYRQRNLTLTEIQSDSVSKLAEKYFGGKKVKWDPKVVETIMNEELVASNFSSHKLVLLELSHYLEKVVSCTLMIIVSHMDSSYSFLYIVPLAKL